jgi:UDP-glucose 4-epimerase
MSILVTGGAGYIGSHVCAALLNNGYDVVVIDNLSNSSSKSLEKIKEITGKEVKFYKDSILNREVLDFIFQHEKIEAVIHFAGFKSKVESVSNPLLYYNNNLAGTLILIETMIKYEVKNIVFSSSATVYGNPHEVPIKEDFPLSATNPYARTKLMLEEIFQDIYTADPAWNIILLRYFNPIGAHSSGLIGEDAVGINYSLIPNITQVALGNEKCVEIYGNDYDTVDGTGVRDYIHITDLVNGHLKALEKMNENKGLLIYNLGTGKGYSVLEVIKEFSEITGLEIPYIFKERREGDVGACYADPTKAKEEMNWSAEYDLKKMCEDSWKWQWLNPNGYR